MPPKKRGMRGRRGGQARRGGSKNNSEAVKNEGENSMEADDVIVCEEDSIVVSEAVQSSAEHHDVELNTSVSAETVTTPSEGGLQSYKAKELEKEGHIVENCDVQPHTENEAEKSDEAVPTLEDNVAIQIQDEGEKSDHTNPIVEETISNQIQDKAEISDQGTSTVEGNIPTQIQDETEKSHQAASTAEENITTQGEGDTEISHQATSAAEENITIHVQEVAEISHGATSAAEGEVASVEVVDSEDASMVVENDLVTGKEVEPTEKMSDMLETVDHLLEIEDVLPETTYELPETVDEVGDVGSTGIELCEVDKEAEEYEREEEDVQYIDEEAEENQQGLEVLGNSSKSEIQSVQNESRRTETSQRQETIVIDDGNEMNIPDNQEEQSMAVSQELEGINNSKFEEISEGSIDQVDQEEVILEISDVEIIEESELPKSRQSDRRLADSKKGKTRVPFREAESLEEVFFATENEDVKIMAEDKDNDEISDTSLSDHGDGNLSLEEISDDELEPSRKRRKSLGQTPVKTSNSGISDGRKTGSSETDRAIKSLERVEASKGVTPHKRTTSEVRDGSEANSNKRPKTSVADEKADAKDDEPAFFTGICGASKKEGKETKVIESGASLAKQDFQHSRDPPQASRSESRETRERSLSSRDHHAQFRRRHELISFGCQTEPRLLKGKIVQCNISPLKLPSDLEKSQKLTENVTTTKLLDKCKLQLPSSITEKMFVDITSLEAPDTENTYAFSMGPVTLSDMDSLKFRDVALRRADKFSLAFDKHCQGIFKATLSKHEDVESLIRALKRLELGNRYMVMTVIYKYGDASEANVWKATLMYMYEQDIQMEMQGLTSDGKIRTKLCLNGVPKGVSKDFIHLIFPEALSVGTGPGANEDRVITLGFSNTKMVGEVLTCYDMMVVNGCQVKISSMDSPQELSNPDAPQDVAKESDVVNIEDTTDTEEDPGKDEGITEMTEQAVQSGKTDAEVTQSITKSNQIPGNEVKITTDEDIPEQISDPSLTVTSTGVGSVEQTDKVVEQTSKDLSGKQDGGECSASTSKDSLSKVISSQDEDDESKSNQFAAGTAECLVENTSKDSLSEIPLNKVTDNESKNKELPGELVCLEGSQKEHLSNSTPESSAEAQIPPTTADTETVSNEVEVVHKITGAEPVSPEKIGDTEAAPESPAKATMNETISPQIEAECKITGAEPVSPETTGDRGTATSGEPSLPENKEAGDNRPSEIEEETSVGEVLKNTIEASEDLHENTNSTDVASEKKSPTEKLSNITGDENLEDVSDEETANQSKLNESDDVVILREDPSQRIVANIDLTRDESNMSTAHSLNGKTQRRDSQGRQESEKSRKDKHSKSREEEKEPKLVMTDGSLEVSMEVIDVVADEEEYEKILYSSSRKWSQDRSREGRSLEKDKWAASSQYSKVEMNYSSRESQSKEPVREDVSRISHSYPPESYRDESPRMVPAREETSVRREKFQSRPKRSRTPSPPRKEYNWYRPQYVPERYTKADQDDSSERQYSSSEQYTKSYDRWQPSYYGDSSRTESYTRLPPEFSNRRPSLESSSKRPPLESSSRRPPLENSSWRPLPESHTRRSPLESSSRRPLPESSSRRPPPESSYRRPPPESKSRRSPLESSGRRPPPETSGRRPPPEPNSRRPPPESSSRRPPLESSSWQWDRQTRGSACQFSDVSRGDQYISARPEERYSYGDRRGSYHSQRRYATKSRSRSPSFSDMSESSDSRPPSSKRRHYYHSRNPRAVLTHTSRSPISISSRSRSLSPVSKSPSPIHSQTGPAKKELVNTVKHFLHLAKGLQQQESYKKPRIRSRSPKMYSSRHSVSPQPMRVHSPPPISGSSKRYVGHSSHRKHSRSPYGARSRSPPPSWARTSRSPDEYEQNRGHRSRRSPSPVRRIVLTKHREDSPHSKDRRDPYPPESDSARYYHLRKSDQPVDTAQSHEDYSSRSRTGHWPVDKSTGQYRSSDDQTWQQSYGDYQQKQSSAYSSTNPGSSYSLYPPPGYPPPSSSYVPQPQETNAYSASSVSTYQYTNPAQYNYASMPANVPNLYTPPVPSQAVAQQVYQQAFSVLQSAMSSTAMSGPPIPQTYTPSQSNAPANTAATSSGSSKSSSAAKNQKTWSMGSNAMVFQRILGADGGRKKKSGVIEKVDRERLERPKQAKEERVLINILGKNKK